MTDDSQSGLDDRALVSDFRDHLPANLRRRYAHDTTRHAQLLAAIRRGWTPAAVAGACGHDIDDAGVGRRIAWAAQHNPPQPVDYHRPTQSLATCQHPGADPNGWVMDDDGAITGRCPCWTTEPPPRGAA
jgi:hypothetical protein